MSACLDCGGAECICTYRAIVKRLHRKLERMNRAAIRASIAMEEAAFSDPGAFDLLRSALIDPAEFEEGGPVSELRDLLDRYSVGADWQECAYCGTIYADDDCPACRAMDTADEAADAERERRYDLSWEETAGGE